MDDAVHVFGLIRGAFGHVIIRLAAGNRGRQRTQPGLLCLFVKIVLGDDIGKCPVHREQFRDILELCEPAFQLVIYPGGIKFPAVGNLAERGCPGIKMLDALGL